MAVNLVSLVSQALTPQMVSQIATAVGIPPDVAQKLVAAAVPSVMAALAGAANQPGGAQKISDLVSNADSDVLGKLSSALAGGQTAALSQGAGALSGILGGSGLSSLAGAIGQFAGASPAQAQTALGAVSQATVGVLGQQDPDSWSDANAISKLFAGQKDTILAALPSGLSNVLSSSGLLSGLSGIGATASAAGVAAASRATSTVTSAASSASSMGSGAMNRAATASSSTGMPMWLIIVIVVIVIAGALWYFTREKAPEPAKTGLLAPTIEMSVGDAKA
jgi:hypothetical protein